jgi:hypothetical protein
VGSGLWRCGGEAFLLAAEEIQSLQGVNEVVQMNKKVAITAKPERTQPAEAWVNRRHDGSRLKRLTVDIPEDVHRRFKSRVAEKGTTMADEILRFLEEQYS